MFHADLHEIGEGKEPLNRMHPLEDDFRDVQELNRGKKDEDSWEALKKIAWRWNLIYQNACAYCGGKIFAIIDTSKKGNRHLRLGEKSKS